MTTTTRERNYTRNPHTATFLQVFHTGVSSTTGRNYREEMAVTEAEALTLEASQDMDLLDLVPAEHVADLRSEAQSALMERLIAQISELDAGLAAQARTYTDGMTEHGRWTPGRTGTASRWISNMIDKIKTLKASAPRTPAAPAAEVADGRYAVEHEGTLKFFRVKNGRRAGMVFLDVQASDDWHAIRNVPRIREIVALIAQDAHGALVRYGRELGECGRCGKALTDEASRAAGIGPICINK